MAGTRGTGWGKLVGAVLGGAAAAAAGTVVTRAIAAGRPTTSESGAATSDRPASPQEISPARPGIAERLAQMVQLPTVSATVDQTGPADFTAFESLLRELYPLIHQHLAFEKTGEFGLLYRWTGASADQPIVLMAHYDVVPAVEEDGWTDPPFAGVIRDGVVYGRGTLDDKGPLIVILEAVENLLANGYSPARDIYLAFGGNEESYGSAAARTADLLHKRGISPWLVLDEGGAVIDSPFPGVSVPLAMVGVAEKGIMTVRISAETAGGHASAPAKDSATGRIAHAILRLSKGPFPVSLPAPTQAMLRGLAPHAGFPLRLVVSNLWLFHRPVAALFAALGGETEAMTRTTVAVTMIDGGTAANVLAAKATATLNIRLAVGETTDGVLERLRTVIADPKISYEVLEASAPSPVSPSDNAQFAAVRAAVDATYPGTVTSPYVMMAGTDSRHFHQYWPAVYRFSPLAMTAEQRASIHGINEHVTIDSLERGDRFFQTLIRSRQH